MGDQKIIAPKFIKDAIENEIKKAVQEELTEAQKRIEERKTQIVSSVMLSINKYMHINRIGETTEFIIRIE